MSLPVINPKTGRLTTADLVARRVADEARALRSYRHKLQTAICNSLPIEEVERTIAAIIEIRDNPEVDPRVRLAACSELLDRTVGKPRVIQEVEVEQRRENVLEIITQRFGLTMLEGEVVEAAERIGGPTGSAGGSGDGGGEQLALPAPPDDEKP
jgi:hypothetical protein